jgi:N-acetylglutamate synthase-like GNAT family acetyltransferase
MKISEALASQMAELISPLSEKGILMPKTAAEIFASQDHWHPQFDTNGNIIGFFEYRTHENTQLAEMGSVLSLQSGIGQCLLQIFNTQKDIRGASGGFAVTKDFKTANQFFAEQTQGDVSTEFPKWFEREKSDRYFIQWR